MHMPPEYEYRPVTFLPDVDRDSARVTLAIHAEFGDWELARVQMWRDGRRHVTLRRKRTPHSPPLPT